MIKVRQQPKQQQQSHSLKPLPAAVEKNRKQKVLLESHIPSRSKKYNGNQIKDLLESVFIGLQNCLGKCQRAVFF